MLLWVNTFHLKDNTSYTLIFTTYLVKGGGVENKCYSMNRKDKLFLN